MSRMQALAAPRYDVAVIGAGATGVGIARDAALRGLRVLLVDRADIAAGTSSGSSRLIHGGLRYLMQGQLALVRECLSERTILRRLAPHLVRPATFMMALYRGAVRERWPLLVGLKLARRLAKDPSEPQIAFLPPDDLVKIVPRLRREGLRGALRFHDAITSDARLCLEVALGARAAGATVATYVEALAVEEAADGALALRLRDRRSGEEARVLATRVAQALGPWTGALDVGRGVAAPTVAPTRGVHLALPPLVPASTVVAAPHPKDGRFTFAIGFDSHTWLGTTDVPHVDSPDACAPSSDEISYLRGWLDAYMPGASASAYLARAALRPLVASLRSRDFSAGFTERGVLVVAGGKLTSHRAMAEAAVDQLLARTPVPDGSAPRSRTTETLLPGAPPLPLELWLRDGPGAGLVPEPVRRHLLLRYGARAPGVFARIERDPSSARPLHPERPEILAEVDFAVEEELATTLSDVMWRRLGLAFSRDGGAAAVDAVDRRLAERLGLSTAERRASRERFEQERAAALLAPADLVEAAG